MGGPIKYINTFGKETCLLWLENIDSKLNTKHKFEIKIIREHPFNCWVEEYVYLIFCDHISEKQ